MIDPRYYGLIEMGFTGAVVLGFAIWQLVSVHREIGRDKRSEEAPRHPVREHRLDDRGGEAP